MTTPRFLVESDSWDSDPDAWDDDQRVWNDSGIRFTRQVMAVQPDQFEFRALDQPEPFTVAAFVEKADMVFGDPVRFKCLRRLHLRWEGRGLLTIRCGARNTLADPIVWQPPITRAAGVVFANMRLLGKFITVRFESDDEYAWRIDGFDIEVEMRGYH